MQLAAKLARDHRNQPHVVNVRDLLTESDGGKYQPKNRQSLKDFGREGTMALANAAAPSDRLTANVDDSKPAASLARRGHLVPKERMNSRLPKTSFSPSGSTMRK